MVWCLYHLLQYFDIAISIVITPYSDNVKLIRYHNSVIHQQLLGQAYIDDMDLWYLLQKFHTFISTRGVSVNPMIKIDKNTTNSTSELNTTNDIHKKMDYRA